MAEKISLTELRKEIVKVTLEIFRLCGERLQLAKKVAETKARENIAIENLKVEEELEQKVLQACQNCGMDTGFCSRLLELLLDESKKVQREVLKLRS